MSDTTTELSAFVQRTIVTLAVAVALLMVAGTAALWAHYGTAVFYEIILAGLNACF
jgi:hypothetical protein